MIEDLCVASPPRDGLRMQQPVDPRLFRGLSIYQDVVIDGQTLFRGTRDCAARWETLDPQLPRRGAILDVGSNFGWFGLQICRSRPDCVVASAEADLRSAAVQCELLRHNRSDRVCLLTQPAGQAMARRFAAAGQRFEAVLCLSILHWIRDHREFLTTLGPISGRFLIEQPDPREDGAGVDRIRREIGPIGDYLRALFPRRPVQCLGRLPSHRASPWLREIWLVAEPPDWPPTAAAGLEADALLDLSPGWPPRQWWQVELARAVGAEAAQGQQALRMLLTPQGLRVERAPDGRGFSLREWHGRLRAVPRRTAFLPGVRFYRRLRQIAGRLWRKFGPGR